MNTSLPLDGLHRTDDRNKTLRRILTRRQHYARPLARSSRIHPNRLCTITQTQERKQRPTVCICSLNASICSFSLASPFYSLHPIPLTTEEAHPIKKTRKKKKALDGERERTRAPAEDSSYRSRLIAHRFGRPPFDLSAHRRHRR